jgi:DNA primase
LIKDIVSSIAKIPDPIKRSVYLRECSNLLQVPEDVLMAESNKLIINTLKKRDEKAARQPEAASDSAHFIPSGEWPTEMPPVGSHGEMPPEFQTTDIPVREKRTEIIQERDIVRLLIQYGNRVLEQENTTVAEYILADIEESLGSFDNPLYGKIASECHELVLQGKTFDQHYFIQHESSEICELAINLLATPWEFSPNWEAMWNYPLQNQPMPDLNISKDMQQALLRFKLQKVMRMCEMNLARVKSASQAGDEDEMMRYMKIQQKLNETRNEIARLVGTVVLPK